MADYRGSQSLRNKNHNVRRANDSTRTVTTKNAWLAEPMVTESSDVPMLMVPGLDTTQELLQMLDNIKPLIDKSRQEVTTATDRLTKVGQEKETTCQMKVDASNENLIKQEKTIEELKKHLTEREHTFKGIEVKLNAANVKLEQTTKDNYILQQRVAERADKIKDLEYERDTHKRGIDQLSTINESLKSRLQQVMKEKNKVEEELNTVKTRLSKVLGNKISDNNPDIADLSDVNRPTKIAEKYSELYDNEWTDAFEEFDSRYHNDKQSANDLLQILRMAKQHCDTMAVKQLKQITEALYFTKYTRDDCQVNVKKEIKDMRKEAALRSMQQVQELFYADIAGRVSDRNLRAIFQTDKVKRYMRKCVEICWLMSVQDPPLTFGVDVRENDAFDKDKYKHYTQTGAYIEYLVWPDMYLKEGALLCKGVAQGAGRTQSAREGRRRDDNPHDGIPIPQSAPQTRNEEDQKTPCSDQQGYDDSYHKQGTADANDQKTDAKSLSKRSRGHVANKSANEPTRQIQANAMMIRSTNEKMKMMCPPDVKLKSWTDFLYYVKLYGIRDKFVATMVGEEYSVCLQHYNTNFSTESDV